MVVKPLDTRAKATPRKVDDTHYLIDSDILTLVAYNLRRNPYGAWECDCPHYVVKHECKHERKLAEVLGDIEPAARRKVTLESLYDDAA